MSGMAARCRVSRLSECLLIISEQAVGLLLVKRTLSIGKVQRTFGISVSNPRILQRYYCYRPNYDIAFSRSKADIEQPATI